MRGCQVLRPLFGDWRGLLILERIIEKQSFYDGAIHHRGFVGCFRKLRTSHKLGRKADSWAEAGLQNAWSLLESGAFSGLQEGSDVPAKPSSCGIKLKADFHSLSGAARFWNVSSVRQLRCPGCSSSRHGLHPPCSSRFSPELCQHTENPGT